MSFKATLTGKVFCYSFCRIQNETIQNEIMFGQSPLPRKPDLNLLSGDYLLVRKHFALTTNSALDHRHLREIDCSLAIVGWQATGAESINSPPI